MDIELGNLDKVVVHVGDLMISTSLLVFSMDTEADNQQKTLIIRNFWRGVLLSHSSLRMGDKWQLRRIRKMNDYKEKEDNLTMLELRKMNYDDVVEQWKYVTVLPKNEIWNKRVGYGDRIDKKNCTGGRDILTCAKKKYSIF